MIRQITEFIMKLRGATNIDIELYRLRRNIAKDNAILEEMDRRWREEQSPCCPGCRFSPLYNDICDKQDRRMVMEAVLLKRKIGGKK